jgi:hypothetical protein
MYVSLTGTAPAIWGRTPAGSEKTGHRITILSRMPEKGKPRCSGALQSG